MKARIENGILYLDAEDVPQYKKNGSVVRNSYFWALRSISDCARRSQDWEYDESVWVALQRLLLSFTESNYLGLRETMLEFSTGVEIPEVLKSVATWE
jgi:hypothetical protein